MTSGSLYTHHIIRKAQEVYETVATKQQLASSVKPRKLHFGHALKQQKERFSGKGHYYALRQVDRRLQWSRKAGTTSSHGQH